MTDTHPGGATEPARIPAALAGLGGLAAVGASGLIARGDGGVPLCPTRLLTGLDCPVCGATRALGALAHGDLIGVADHNLVVAAAIPILVALWIRWMWTGIPFPAGRRVPRGAWLAVGAALIAFTLLRNLPAPAWAQWMGSTAWR